MEFWIYWLDLWPKIAWCDQKLCLFWTELKLNNMSWILFGLAWNAVWSELWNNSIYCQRVQINLFAAWLCYKPNTYFGYSKTSTRVNLYVELQNKLRSRKTGFSPTTSGKWDCFNYDITSLAYNITSRADMVFTCVLFLLQKLELTLTKLIDT